MKLGLLIVWDTGGADNFWGTNSNDGGAGVMGKKTA